MTDAQHDNCDTAPVLTVEIEQRADNVKLAAQKNGKARQPLPLRVSRVPVLREAHEHGCH